MRGVGVETQENTICLWKLIILENGGVPAQYRVHGVRVGSNLYQYTFFGGI